MPSEMLLSRSAKEAHLKRALATGSRGLESARVPAACYKAMVDPFKLVPDYDWFGYYRLEGKELVLEYSLGEPTEHIRIAAGKGVCGAAVSKDRNMIVEDVEAVSNYLSCSPDVRSEIVVLVRDPGSGRVLGELDADSHTLAAFDEMDEEYLGQAGDAIALRLSRLSERKA
jgi:putative methionine-R-sulfoxide reductase with GAF domain